jgi:hypothetical protein
MSLTPAQRWAINADLSIIREMGFGNVRLLITTTGGDPSYAPWPRGMFFSWPTPTPAELENLVELGQLTKIAGLTYEIVILMPAASGLYYQNGVTSADYQKFATAVFNYAWGGLLSRIYLAGDLRLGDHDDDPAVVANHRQFILTEWPAFKALCPPCGSGFHLSSANAKMWDRAVDSMTWVRANVSPLPTVLGCALYPSSHAWLRAAGWEAPSGIVNWDGLTEDWVTNLRAAAGPILLVADEVGMLLQTADPVHSDLTLSDQKRFLPAAIGVLSRSGVAANVWEFARHTGYGDFGIIDAQRYPRPVVGPLQAELCQGSLRPHGVQYTPPEFNGLEWLTPM